MKKVYCLNENDERVKNGSKVPVQKRYRRVRRPINEEEYNNEDNFEYDEIDESFDEFKNRKGYLYEKFFRNVRPGASIEDFMDDEEDETPVRMEKRRYAKEDNFQFNRGKIEQTSPFILGIASAKVGEKYTFIDKTGRLLCGLYDYIEVDPKQRDAKIVYRGKTFYIDLMATNPEILRDDLRKLKKRFGINESLRRIDRSKSAKRVLKESSFSEDDEQGTDNVTISITSDGSGVELYGKYSDCERICDILNTTMISRIYINDRLVD